MSSPSLPPSISYVWCCEVCDNIILRCVTGGLWLVCWYNRLSAEWQGCVGRKEVCKTYVLVPLQLQSQRIAHYNAVRYFQDMISLNDK